MHTQFARAFAHLSPTTTALDIPLTKTRTSATATAIHVQLLQSISKPATATAPYASHLRLYRWGRGAARLSSPVQGRGGFRSPAVDVDDDVLITTLYAGGVSTLITKDTTVSASPESTVRCARTPLAFCCLIANNAHTEPSKLTVPLCTDDAKCGACLHVLSQAGAQKQA
jgi:hypothetical protein